MKDHRIFTILKRSPKKNIRKSLPIPPPRKIIGGIPHVYYGKIKDDQL